jgi:ClpP class serine protease
MSNHFVTLVGGWHIDTTWGIEKLNEYLSNIDLVKSTKNTTLFDKAFEASRNMSIIDQNTGSISTITDFSEIPNEGGILELNFSNVMRNEDGWCSIGINSLTNMLYQAYGTPKIKGILLNLNSGGGESSSGFNLQGALLDKNKPVVVRTMLLGSAAVNGAIGASEIIASSDAAEIGSIGSYIALDNNMVSYLKENIKYVYSKVSPNKNKSFRDILDNDDYSLLEEEATQNAKMFQKAVTKYRNLRDTTKEDTLSGGMFYAQDAKRRGLIDAVGTRNFALKRVNSLIKYST